MKLFKKSKPQFQLYNSIENLPIYNWNKINTTNDLRYLAKDYDNAKVDKTYYDMFSQIYNQYYQHFGISDNLREYLKAKSSIEVMKYDYVVTNNSILLSRINIKEEEIQKLYESNQQDFFEQVEILTRWRKIPIDTKTMSVVEFNTILNQYQKEISSYGRQDKI